MTKIDKTTVQEEACMTKRQVDYMEKTNPKKLDLLKKGIMYERIESGLMANELIRKPNKTKSKG